MKSNIRARVLHTGLAILLGVLSGCGLEHNTTKAEALVEDSQDLKTEIGDFNPEKFKDRIEDYRAKVDEFKTKIEAISKKIHDFASRFGAGLPNQNVQSLIERSQQLIKESQDMVAEISKSVGELKP